MRSILIKIALFFALPMLLGGCEIFEDYIVDWAPVSLVLKVTDSDGNDLLDLTRDENILKGTSVSYKGVDYPVRTEFCDKYHDAQTSSVETKAYLATMYGLYLVSSSMTGYASYGKGYSLIFGEIDGASDMDEDIVISWPNGQTSTIHYHCSDHREGKNPKCNRYYTLDGGNKTESNIFTFVLDNK